MAQDARSCRTKLEDVVTHNVGGSRATADDVGVEDGSPQGEAISIMFV